MNNRKRLKKLILANKETRWLYRMMQFLAIFMVVSCLVIITLAKWIEYDQNKKREELFGSWDEVFLNVDKEDLNYFRKNAFLEEISIQSIQEKVFLEGDQRVVIGSCDGNFLEMGNIELLEGRMPEQKKEVAVEAEYLEILGVSKVGDVVSNESEVGSLFGYKVVGVIENYSNKWKMINQDVNYASCFIVNNNPRQYQVFCKFKRWSNFDPEINFIEYRKNISDYEYGFFQIYKIIGVVLFAELLILISMKNKLYTMENINVRKAKKSMNDRTFIKIFIIIELLIMILLCTLLINLIEMPFSFLDLQEFEIFLPNEGMLEANNSEFTYMHIVNRELRQVNINVFYNLDEIVEYLINSGMVLLLTLCISSIESNVLYKKYMMIKEMAENQFYFFNVKRKDRIVYIIRTLFIFTLKTLIMILIGCIFLREKYQYATLGAHEQVFNNYCMLCIVINIIILVLSYMSFVKNSRFIHTRYKRNYKYSNM